MCVGILPDFIRYLRVSVVFKYHNTGIKIREKTLWTLKYEFQSWRI
jgi:hypothetical protein